MSSVTVMFASPLTTTTFLCKVAWRCCSCLRRTSYAVEEDTGFFREETAKVFGVPFELIPFKVEGGAAQPPTPPANQIYAVPEKAEYEIEFPVVDGYTDPGLTQITLHWDRVSTLVMDPMDVPDSTLVQGLSAVDGALIAYGPGRPNLLVSLAAALPGVPPIPVPPVLPTPVCPLDN